MNEGEYIKRKLREELLKIEDNNLYEEMKRVHEGLIFTHSPEAAKKFIQHWGSNKKSNSNLGGNTILPVEITKDGTIIVSLIYFEDNLKQTDWLLKTMNNYGYFPSTLIFTTKDDGVEKKIKYNDNDLKILINHYKELNNSSIIFEAKFDREITTPPKLYYVTNQIYKDKILKIGLVPKSKSKQSTHPDRIYLGLTYSDAYDFAHQVKKPNEKYCIFEIDTNKIKYLKLFEDPNYKNFGVYTLMNIPKEAIKVIKENI